MPRVAKASKPADSTANLGFEAKLWLAADKLRNRAPIGTIPVVCSGAVSAPTGSAVTGRRYNSHRSVDLLGRIYDPACGSGGMFVQSEKFVESHGGTAMRDSAKLISEASPRELREAKHHRGDISVYGQAKWARRKRPFGLAKRARRVRLRRQQPKQSNATTRRLAIMNLAIRGIEADFGPEHADTFRRDLHPDLRADTATRVSAKTKPRSHSAGLLRSERQLLANPPFNDSDTALRGSAFPQSEAKAQVVSEAKDNFRKDDDVRWKAAFRRKGLTS